MVCPVARGFLPITSHTSKQRPRMVVNKSSSSYAHGGKGSSGRVITLTAALKVLPNAQQSKCNVRPRLGKVGRVAEDKLQCHICAAAGSGLHVLLCSVPIHTHRLAATVCVCLFVCVRVSSGQKLALSSILLSLSPCRSQSRTELRGSWKSLVHALCCNPPLLVTGMVCSTPLTCQLLSASLCVCVSLLSCAHQRTYPSNPARTLYTQSQTTHHPAPISPLLCNPVSDPSPSIERATFHWLATRRFYCSGFVTQLTSLPVFTIC